MTNQSIRIDKTTENFLQSFDGLSTEQLNWKPNVQTWSIAQNIDHLIVINQSYFPIIDSIRKGTYRTPFLAKLGFIVSFFGNMILNSVHPSREKKIKTFAIWEPAKSEIPSGILDRFSEHQTELKDRIESSQDLIAKGTIISSPANKNIVYKLEKAFEIMVTHEERHFEQSMEAYELMKKETSSKQEEGVR